MPRNSIGQYSTTPGDNTDIGGINIAEGMLPSDVNNAMRELLSQLKEFQTGAGGDTISPPVLIATTATVGTLKATSTATFDSAVILSSDATLRGQSDLRFADSDSSNWVAFQAPATVSSNVTWTLPAADGTNGQLLSTNGSGTLSWASGGGGSSISAGDSKVEVTDTGTGKIEFTVDNVEIADFTTGAVVFNETGADQDFRVEGDTIPNLLFVNAGEEAVVIGGQTPLGLFNLVGVERPAGPATYTTAEAPAKAQAGLNWYQDANANYEYYLDIFTTGTSESPFGGSNIRFLTTAVGTATATERARITSGGDFLVSKTVANNTTAGFRVESGGFTTVVRDGAPVFRVDRLTNDGDVVEISQGNTIEGTISVSGNTVSYNAFTGGHWSQLQEGRGYNPDIPRGTVMSTIGDMCLWKSVEWTETIEHAAMEEKEAWTETIPHRESYLGDLPVGATFEEDGFTKTIVDDGNERLPKVKISDVVGDKAVYGVFQTWDDVQDMLITSLGAFVVRIAAGVTVEIGDLLESNGDGCAKVQDDDIIRSKTIAKVTSTTPTETYADGSYTVPAVIYCG